MRAIYTLRTDDGHFVLVNATGIYRNGPKTVTTTAAAAKSDGKSVSQDQAEYFTHIAFEAPGPRKPV